MRELAAETPTMAETAVAAAVVPLAIILF